MADLMLGGLPIELHAGAPEFNADPLEGSSVVRMSDGQGVKMTHWSGKMAGTISGAGWMPPGLDGLDYSRPLELRSTQAECVTTNATTVVLSSVPRPDYEPWCLALVRESWVDASSAYFDGAVTIEPVPGATRYAVYWLPIYFVYARKPRKSNAGGVHGWTLDWEEV